MCGLCYIVPTETVLRSAVSVAFAAADSVRIGPVSSAAGEATASARSCVVENISPAHLRLRTPEWSQCNNSTGIDAREWAPPGLSRQFCGSRAAAMCDTHDRRPTAAWIAAAVASISSGRRSRLTATFSVRSVSAAAPSSLGQLTVAVGDCSSNRVVAGGC